MRRPILSMLLALAVATPALALDNENLLVTVPKGFKVGFTKKSDQQMITEMVPENESVENWTEIVTVQIFYNLRDVPPAQYRARLEKAGAEACPGASFAKIKDGTEQLYPMVSWSQRCPLNKQSGKPEFTWFKVVQGRDSFYVVQKAFKAEPTERQLKAMAKFFDSSRVCDSRVPGQRCKPGK
uniref:Uncharacterized protein n=1 Tax=Rhodopseudomonas palustris (strain BisA53) TaxID=316055 RepID=Q07KS1_RHOP5